MKPERSASKSKPSRSVRVVRNGLAGLLAIAGLSALASGCLDRPVVPAEPTTQSIFVSSISETAVNKIDLLFMIDNSTSMADKQKILAQAVPQLLSRLITPDCVDGDGKPIVVNGSTLTADQNGDCSQGSPEFRAVRDIHIGIVTSSLGDRGASPTVCASTPPTDDSAELVGTPGLRPADPQHPFTTYNSNSGFLAWDPDGKDQPVRGEANKQALITNFTNMVYATGQSGCGFESQLESWYRFLVDPHPPEHLDATGSGSSRHTVAAGGDDQTVLAERAAFLRPDSLVAIIMLSDENDCSMIDHGQAFLVGSQPHPLPRATSACDTNPNDKCCFSCGQIGTPPSGCPTVQNDPNCKLGPYQDSGNDDALNLRCFDQKRRFGISLLFPTERYVNALTQTRICPNHDDLSCGPDDTPVPNPLFSQEVGGKVVPGRSTQLVFLAGIVGVPWQDIATQKSLSSSSLSYLTAKELNQPIANPKSSVPKNATYWDLILGNPDASPPVPPLDPFMHESSAPRTSLPSTTNPITGATIQPPPTTTPNAINGHEYSIPDGSDLQYACIFNLPKSRDCSLAANASDCDCSPDLATYKDNPLCYQNRVVDSGTPSTTQYSAKGYPGLRELEVLKGVGDNAIVGSICPKNVCTPGDSTCADANYGYNPAVNAIIQRLKSALNGACLPRQLAVTTTCTDASGKVVSCGSSQVANKDVSVPCKVVEAFDGPDPCSTSGRSPLTSSSTDNKVKSAVIHLLGQEGVCSANGGDNTKACSSFNMCYIDATPGSPTTPGSAEYECLNDANVSNTTAGYCYVDPSQGSGSKALVAGCNPAERRLLRLVSGVPGDQIPKPGSETFVACSGVSFNTGSP